jgi:hypothetical protein
MASAKGRRFLRCSLDFDKICRSQRHKLALSVNLAHNAYELFLMLNVYLINPMRGALHSPSGMDVQV